MNFLKKLPVFLLVILVIGWIIGNQVAYILTPIDASILLQFGKPVGEPNMEPGLFFKLPLVQNVITFDKRLLDYDTSPKIVITLDKKTLKVDYFAKWKIIDPLVYFTSVNNELGAKSRLDDIIYSELRVELGSHNLQEIVSEKRNAIMKTVTERSDVQMKRFGIKVVDVRIKRADLPQENEAAVFKRMISERERVAKQYRSEGEQKATKIRAEADRQRIEIIAVAQKESEEIRGEGDEKAIQIYADAYNTDPEFYEFYRSIEAYKNSMKDGMTLYLTPNSRFLKYLNDFDKNFE